MFANLFSAVADEMGVTLQRTSFSPNIKLRRDFSCALFDEGGRLLAQAAHIPVHLGAMPMAMETVLRRFELRPGDVVIMNDPFTGGTHLPDVSLVSAAFDPSGRRLGYVMSRAHHADIGGMAPGSMPLSTELFQEGMIIPPILLVREHAVQWGLLEVILRNVRTPDERRGDFDAQLAAQRVGEGGLVTLSARYGADSLAAHGRGLQDYAESLMRGLVDAIPPGQYSAEDALDGDGQIDEPVPIHVTVTRREGSSSLGIDYDGSSAQCLGCINAVAAVTASATLYVMRCLLGEESPVNAGSMRPLEIRIPAGSVVGAKSPAAVAGGNVETSQRIVDVLFRALARALPDRVPAASQGTMNNFTCGGFDRGRGRHFAYYETMGGGMGGRPRRPGASGVHDHMSNTWNTPVEALESELPLRVMRYELRSGTGGGGSQPGGDGIRRDLLFLEAAEVTLLTERRRLSPYGLHGGASGATGLNVLVQAGGQHTLPEKTTFRAQPGDSLSIQSPGGGGWGPLLPEETP